MQKVNVVSRKYDGSLRDEYETSLVAETDESILLFSEPGLPYWHGRKAAWFEAPDGLIEIYFKHQWYNVFYRRIKAELRTVPNSNRRRAASSPHRKGIMDRPIE